KLQGQLKDPHWKVWKFVPLLRVKQNKESVHNVTVVTLLPIKWFSAVKLLVLWLPNPLVSLGHSLPFVRSTWEVLQGIFPKKINWWLNLTVKQRLKILKPLKAKTTKEKRWISLFPVLLDRKSTRLNSSHVII